jgi:hypothetical protein
VRRILTTTLLAAALLTAALVGVAVADTITVGSFADYPTIQQGLDAATGGDEVLVMNGTYSGHLNTNLDFHGASIHLRADTPWGVTIDCEGSARAFLFDDGEDTLAVVDGFTITHGDADAGGAAYVVDSSVKFTTCTFEGNHALDGGAVAADNGAVVLRECTFTANDANHSAGALLLVESVATVSGCTFTGNDCYDDWIDERSYGGAARVVGSQTVFNGCTFEENRAKRGGAISLKRPSDMSVSDCIFRGNVAGSYWTSREGYGAAVHMFGCSPVIDHCWFERNEPTGGGTVWGDYSSPVMSYCTFFSNKGNLTPDLGHDVELYHTDIEDAVISHCTFCGWRMDGDRDDGALLRFGDCEPLIERCIIAFYNYGPGVRCVGTGEPTIRECIVFGNTGGDEICGDDPENNLSEDPLFCGFWDGNLTLCANSPGLPWNNAWDIYIGAQSIGCNECDTPVRERSWGAIKAMYR